MKKKLERAVARYIKALDYRQKVLDREADRYSLACDRAAAASKALGDLDPDLRTQTFLNWNAKPNDLHSRR